MDDDLLTIRRALHSGPPSAAATTRARNLLTAEIAAAAARPVGGAVAPRTRSPLKNRRIWWGRGALLTGGLAAVIAVGLVAGLPSGTDRDEPGGSPPDAQATPATAQDLLLAAAQRAGEAPATRGKYWHVRKLTVAGSINVGSYDLVGRWLNETWTPWDTSVSSWTGDLQLGFRPRTAAGEEAWRAAGAPTTWTVKADTTSGTTTFRAAPGEPTLREQKRPVFLGDLGGLTLAEIAGLPTDPAALRTRVAADVEGAGDVAVFSRLSQLLLESPAPPAVRAAAFRALAGIPGVRTVGAVTDGNGRTGTGIELTLTGDVDSRHLLIIDPKSYLLMGAEHTGTRAGAAKPVKSSNIVILAAGWTDTEPTLPTAP